jgi:hypothetical protein
MRHYNEIDNTAIGAAVGGLKVTEQDRPMDPVQPPALTEFIRGVVEIPRNHPRTLETADVFTHLLELNLVDTLGAHSMLTIESIKDQIMTMGTKPLSDPMFA